MDSLPVVCVPLVVHEQVLSGMQKLFRAKISHTLKEIPHNWVVHKSNYVHSVVLKKICWFGGTQSGKVWEHLAYIIILFSTFANKLADQALIFCYKLNVLLFWIMSFWKQKIRKFRKKVWAYRNPFLSGLVHFVTGAPSSSSFTENRGSFHESCYMAINPNWKIW